MVRNSGRRFWSLLAAVLMAGLASSCGSSTVASGTGSWCRSTQACLALAGSVDQGRHLQLPHFTSYSLTKGNVVHDALGTPWGVTLFYEDRATGQSLTFAAQPASKVTPWCPSPGSSVEFRGREICVVTYAAGGNASFVSTGVRYTVSPVFRGANYVPPSGPLRASLLLMAGSIS